MTKPSQPRKKNLVIILINITIIRMASAIPRETNASDTENRKINLGTLPLPPHLGTLPQEMIIVVGLG